MDETLMKILVLLLASFIGSGQVMQQQVVNTAVAAPVTPIASVGAVGADTGSSTATSLATAATSHTAGHGLIVFVRVGSGSATVTAPIHDTNTFFFCAPPCADRPLISPLAASADDAIAVGH